MVGGKKTVQVEGEGHLWQRVKLVGGSFRNQLRNQECFSSFSRREWDYLQLSCDHSWGDYGGCLSSLSKSAPLSQSWSFGWRFTLLRFQPHFFTAEGFRACSGSSMRRALQVAKHPGDTEGRSVALLMLMNKGGREQSLMPMPRGVNCFTFIRLRVFSWWNELAVNIPTLGFL